MPIENQLAIFQYEEETLINDLTTVQIDGEIWFVGLEVCTVLGLQNVSATMSSLDDDEKMTYSMLRTGQMRNVSLINESALYNLVFRSKKEGAKNFRKWITKIVIPTIRRTGSFGTVRIETPNFVTRYNDNWDRTKKGHFSVISELFIRLYGRFERIGYLIPNKALTGKEIRPDVSVGIGFSKFLKTFYPELADNYTYYSHRFPDGFEVDARQYTNDMLPMFIEYVDEHWMPNCAAKYLGDRDQKALEYLPKLIGK
jgi:prophage antirepressor-like protein